MFSFSESSGETELLDPGGKPWWKRGVKERIFLDEPHTQQAGLFLNTWIRQGTSAW